MKSLGMVMTVPTLVTGVTTRDNISPRDNAARDTRLWRGSVMSRCHPGDIIAQWKTRLTYFLELV